MKLQIVSDIHFEFNKSIFTNLFLNDTKNTVIVIAGDLGCWCQPREEKQTITTPLSWFSDKYTAVVYVLGNHEFYHGVIDDVKHEIKEFCATLGNVHLLDNSETTIDGITFAGCTFWPNIPIQYHNEVVMRINDFKIISDGRECITPDHMKTLHNESVNFLEKAMKKNTKIIVTHFCPSLLLMPDFYKYDVALNSYFNNNIQVKNASVWVYGHTHIGSIKRLEGVTMICNPLGYGSENPKFNNNLIIEV